ncbi:DUF418 domain-containing protein [Actinorugispora endophytica]|uniref:DUF418 domain-containing protein n=1 Tax=Actinorugispora endophytica TaxID=1605990 RepID=A0A4R6UYH6_9ACTN|nr:DUF418 domain-containing protein [Actinorugispora endophytica]TDQ52554.1 uncharacterized protein EV190_106194 [Actinorugispora endophytica]
MDTALSGRPGREPTGTPSPSARLPLLDVLRGAAILGTLATNVWLFASPTAEVGPLLGSDAMASLDVLVADPSAANAVEGVFRFLANGKFLSLLAVLFGAGVAIQYRSAAKRGLRWPRAYAGRSLFLLVEGAVHFTLVFAWDVLMGYAVTGLLTAWLLTRSRAVQGAVMGLAAAAHVTLMSLATWALAVAPQGASDPGDVADVAAVYGDGGYLEQVGLRLDNLLVLRMEPVLSFGLLLFLFLLGARLMRAGAFGPGEAARRLRARMAAWGLGLGLPLSLAASLGGAELVLLERYVLAPVVAVGYIGLIGLVLDRLPRTGPVTGAVSALGRTAMTGYVAQNVLCSLLCYGFGLGLASRLAGSGPWWVLGLWAGVCLFLLAAASLWLRYFPYGPLEWLQKSVLDATGGRRR